MPQCHEDFVDYISTAKFIDTRTKPATAMDSAWIRRGLTVVLLAIPVTGSAKMQLLFCGITQGYSLCTIIANKHSGSDVCKRRGEILSQSVSYMNILGIFQYI